MEITISMNNSDLKKALTHGIHYSADQKKAFVRKDLAKHLRVVNIVILPWEDVKHLKRLWLSPLAHITQTGIKTRLIYDFSWSQLNETVRPAVKKEVMWFG